MVDNALAYSRQYARRFVHSPYASQFADFFVQLVVGHFGEINEEQIDGALEFTDADRRREIFLRIARAAAIAGKNELARLASGKAEALGGDPADVPEALAKLYGGVANISTKDVGVAMQAISAIPDEALSARDRVLRQAAKAVADQVVSRPVAESLAQERPANMANTEDATSPVALSRNELAGPAQAAEGLPASAAATLDPAFKTFVDNGRSKLAAIDDMLKEEKATK
jgi:chemotaxis protein MotC